MLGILGHSGQVVLVGQVGNVLQLVGELGQGVHSGQVVSIGEIED